MIGDCLESELQPVVNLLNLPGFLFNPSLFINPKLPDISGIVACTTSKIADIKGLFLTTPFITDPTVAGHKRDLINAICDLNGDAKVKLVAPTLSIPHYTLVHDNSVTAVGAVSQYGATTNFLSGTTQNFPIGSFTNDVLSEVPNIAILAAMTFPGLMAAVNGAKTIESILCMTNPLNPCGIVNTIFDTLLGGDDTFLNSICANIGSDVLSDLQAMLTGFLNIIIDILNGILDAFSLGIRMSLAKLLKHLDPCMKDLVNNIAGPELSAALAAG